MSSLEQLPPVEDEVTRTDVIQLTFVAQEVLDSVPEDVKFGDQILAGVAFEALQDVPPDADEALERFVVGAAVAIEIDELRDAAAAVKRIKAIKKLARDSIDTE